MSKQRNHRKSQTLQQATPSKLPTSREVYHRIRWDPKFVPATFVLGVEERFSGMIEVPFHAFVPDGEIPWHRVWYFKQGEQIVWDREKRIDLIVSSDRLQSPVALDASSTNAQTETTVISASSDNIAPSLPPNSSVTPDKTEATDTPTATRQPVYRFDTECNDWMVAKETLILSDIPAVKDKMRVASWNVLFDWYDADKIYSSSRWVALLEELLSSNADIIGLQEMTDTCLALLLEHPEIRKQFFVSEIPGGASIQRYGQVILSRYPFRCVRLPFSVGKDAIIAEIIGQSGSFGVAVIHLSSNREAHAAQQRIQQARELLDWLQSPSGEMTSAIPIATWLVMGDCNSRQDDPVELVWSEYGFTEVWPLLHPDLPGYTFVPQANTLAKLNSRSGEPGRLDRMYLRSQEQLFRPCSIQYLGEEPYSHTPEQRYCSDHAGVLCVFEREASQQPSTPTTFAPTTPHENILTSLQDICRDIVRLYDDSMVRLSGIFPYGSAALGAMIPGSDVDLVWVVPDTLATSALLRQLYERLQQKGLLQRSRYREHSVHPVLDLVFEQGNVELSCLQMPVDMLPFLHHRKVPESMLSEHDMSRWRGLYDAYLIQTEMAKYGLESVYPQVLQRIKVWAKQRAISGKAYGYLGGIDWSILVAWSCREACRQGATLSVESMVADFFARCVRWKGEHPIALQEPTPSVKKHPRRDKVMILSPADNPVKNVAHTLLDGTWAVIYREFCRSHRIFQQHGISSLAWAEVILPAQPDPTSDSVCLLLSQPDEQSLDVLVGAEKGALLQNLIRWESESSQDWFRPYPPFVTRQLGDQWCAHLCMERLQHETHPLFRRG